MNRVPRFRRRQPVDRPDSVFDPGLQSERTALAWERTAIAIIVAGSLLARYASETSHRTMAIGGVAMVAFGAGLLVWSAVHYDDLHQPLRDGDSPVHPAAARVVGLGAVAFIGVALVFAIVIAVEG